MNECYPCCPDSYKECLKDCDDVISPEVYRNMIIIGSVAGACLLFIATSCILRGISNIKYAQKNFAPLPVLSNTGDVEWEKNEQDECLTRQHKKVAVQEICVCICCIFLVCVGLPAAFIGGKLVPEPCCVEACKYFFRNVTYLV